MNYLTEHDVAAKITRNVAIGVVLVFVLTVLMVLPSGKGIGVAIGVALLPATFAGPFAGGLLTMGWYQHLQDESKE